MNKDQQFEAIKDLLYAKDGASVNLGILQLQRAAKECDKCKELRDGLTGLWMELRERGAYSDDSQGDIWSLHDMLMLHELRLCVDKPWDGGKISLLAKVQEIRLYYTDSSKNPFNCPLAGDVQLHDWVVNPWPLATMSGIELISVPDGYGSSRAHDQLARIMPQGFAIDALPF